MSLTRGQKCNGCDAYNRALKYPLDEKIESNSLQILAEISSINQQITAIDEQILVAQNASSRYTNQKSLYEEKALRYEQQINGTSENISLALKNVCNSCLTNYENIWLMAYLNETIQNVIATELADMKTLCTGYQNECAADLNITWNQY